MTLFWDKTNRGFTIATFRDLYDQDCSIQESSSADKSAIWFGVDDALWNDIYDHQRIYERNGSRYRHVSARMHLSREMAAILWPILKRFAEEGRIEDAPMS